MTSFGMLRQVSRKVCAMTDGILGTVHVYLAHFMRFPYCWEKLDSVQKEEVVSNK